MSETARMLDDTAERMLARRLQDPMARRLETLRPALFAETIEVGLPLALAPEAEGGLGGTLFQAGVIAWRWGWHAAPLPIVEVLLIPSLSSASEAWMAGQLTLASTPGLELSGGAISGKAIEAPVIGESSIILAIATDAKGHSWLVEIDAMPAEKIRALSGEPWLRLDASAARVRAKRPCPVEPDTVAVRGALLTSAAMMGAMTRILEIAIEYANIRKQFGKPLGKFQAVQHMIAEAASEYAAAQAALAAAIEAEDGGKSRPLLWQSAKAQAGRAATVVSAVGHQVLGAIGFTEEHVLHHYSKRLWTWRDEWGRQTVCEAAIGRAACADEHGLWSHVVDNTSTIANTGDL
ncbi:MULTISPECIES: acyl-CoA dehydrogenase family protein [Mesorhizobium]|uniref:acyl-CoA dehydrogenase family protein n=1 Tax=Mesorhizobium TaxID=68287 RepID=UPI0010A96088|nr:MULTISPECIES: acyl-CoA dehydrogenase family protein [Mesorhizobium]